MVRIKKKKSDTPPSLKSAGAAETQLLEEMSLAGRLAYKYKSALYGSPEVKTKLKELQHDKCCFCEATVSHVSHGDVEHYRPKAGWMQEDKDKLTKPGYYWLAYDFDNLFLSCQICNQKYKRNYFPLAEPAGRVANHTGDIRKEKPLIIDPGRDDPTRHLTFNREVAVAHNDDPKGVETIKRTGLNRPEIMRARYEYLETLQVLAIVARSQSPEAGAARAHFKKVSKVDRIYSLMVQSNFPDLAA